jgi:hypothetical protein
MGWISKDKLLIEARMIKQTVRFLMTEHGVRRCKTRIICVVSCIANCTQAKLESQRLVKQLPYVRAALKFYHSLKNC